MGCRIKYMSGWAARMMHQASMHRFNAAVTLTYDQEHLPADNSLDLRDWQLFMKRLRKSRTGSRIPFYQCGEYSPQNLRPHHHAILFNCHFPDQVENHELSKSNQKLWVSQELNQLWGNGMAWISECTYETCAYVAGYVLKKAMSQQDKRKASERVDQVTGEVYYVRPEFSTMSRNPGIGCDWFDRYGDDVYPSDQVVRSGHKHGHKPPKYYDRKLEERNPDLHAQVTLARETEGKERRFTHDTPARREAREKIVKARLGLRGDR